jgi:hypothetical protein
LRHSWQSGGFAFVVFALLAVSGERGRNLVAVGSGDRGLESVEVENPGVLASLERIDAMSDEELRSPVRGEHPMVVETAEAIIARRHSVERPAT